MADQICLMSGHVSSGNLRHIDKKMIIGKRNKNVLVLNLSWEQPEKLQQKRKDLAEYFYDIGAKQVSFISEDTPGHNLGNLFKNAGILYLPGGNTIYFMNNIKEKGLVQFLFDFNGTILANSAGAYVLCPHYIRIKDNKIETIPSIGLVPLWFKGHYEKGFDPALLALSEEKQIYGVTEGSAIVSEASTGRVEAIGDAFLFSNRQKQRVEQMV